MDGENDGAGVQAQGAGQQAQGDQAAQQQAAQEQTVATAGADGTAAGGDTVCAPISGMLVSQKEINDEVIAEGLLGQGYGILPVGNVVYAPANGRIDAVTVTNHAIGLLTDGGAKIIVHIGLETVNMDGKGFTRYVEAGDIVVAGQPILSFDDEAIKAAGCDDIVTCVVSNPAELESVDMVGSSNTLLGGRPLVKVGDALMVVK